MIKVFIPSYNRPDTIKSHKVFSDPTLWNVKVILHDEEQKQAYETANPELVGKIIVSRVTSGADIGLENQRNFIQDTLVEKGEWYLSADDDIECFTCVIPELYSWSEIPEDKQTKQNYSRVLTEKEFHDIFLEMLATCEVLGYHLFGFQYISNPFFRGKKIRENVLLVGTVFGAKKPLSDNEPLLNPKITGKEDHVRVANNILYYGGCIRNDYVNFQTKMYSAGGIGNKKERTPVYEQAVKDLMAEYPGMFDNSMSRENPEAEVRICVREPRKVKAWRLMMILKNKLSPDYAYKILGKQKGQQFLDTYYKGEVQSQM